MKKVIFLMIILSLNARARSQVIINFQFPPSGVILKSQLWNLSLTSITNEDLNVQLEMILTDISNNQKIISAVSKLFVLSKGMRQIRSNDVMPITYNRVNPMYNIDVSPDGFLPAGAYSVCFALIKWNIETSERIAEECEIVEIEPLSPPMLVSPADNEEVAVSRPFFTWLPPAPFTLFNNLRYDYILTEVQAIQTGTQAVQQNLPLLTSSFIAGSSLQYPVSLPELDTNKIYAWQVTAKNNNNTVAKSEVWTFKVQKHRADTNYYAVNRSYVRLKKDADASYVINDGMLLYEYLNELNDPTATIKIWDISGTTQRELLLDSASISLKFGQNFLKLDLRNNGDIKDKHIYMFELTNSYNEQWYVKFECRRSSQN